jgi:hypothetical protein
VVSCCALAVLFIELQILRRENGHNLCLMQPESIEEVDNEVNDENGTRPTVNGRVKRKDDDYIGPSIECKSNKSISPISLNSVL